MSGCISQEKQVGFEIARIQCLESDISHHYSHVMLCFVLCIFKDSKIQNKTDFLSYVLWKSKWNNIIQNDIIYMSILCIYQKTIIFSLF